MRISIEGMSTDEILALPDEDLAVLIFIDKPISFRAGTSEVLGQFAIDEHSLQVELAHIDGGGEGVLPTIVSIANRYALQKNLTTIEWIVYATNCANPNPKLKRVLERRGFQVRNLPGKGECYHRTATVESMRQNNSKGNPMANALVVICPYKYEGLWVFDDDAVGLVKEPFVEGADVIIDKVLEEKRIVDPDAGFRMIFSGGEFPRYDVKLDWVREGDGGNWYESKELGLEGWLCPALFKYFDKAPEKLYARVENRDTL